MALVTKAIRGTQDLLPAESFRQRYVEQVLTETAGLFGFKEIRTPVFEHTELFQRGVGDTTDVVQKEMYTFNDKGGRSITLRPEGTAGAARAFLEHGLHNEPLPLKVFYLTSCYRYEKPQAGRLREFHQFGIECLGASEPSADAEVISLAAEALDTLGVKNIKLLINSIGCPECRKNYHAALSEYFASHKDELCETCLGRLEKNPMRILDCKSPVCSEIAKGAPKVLDYICDECRDHFEGVKACLDAMGIEYEIDPTIVRGLDYYTRTVFEFVSSEIGAQGTVCGGGRYDGLIEELGGNHVPSLGFGMGIERLMLLLKAQETELPEEPACDIFLASSGREANIKAMCIASDLRRDGFRAQCDIAGRSVKAQMKYAGKLGARYTAVIGERELEEGTVQLKNMENGETQSVSLEDFGEAFMDVTMQSCRDGLESAVAGLGDFASADIMSNFFGGNN